MKKIYVYFYIVGLIIFFAGMILDNGWVYCVGFFWLFFTYLEDMKDDGADYDEDESGEEQDSDCE